MISFDNSEYPTVQFNVSQSLIISWYHRELNCDKTAIKISSMAGVCYQTFLSNQMDTGQRFQFQLGSATSNLPFSLNHLESSLIVSISYQRPQRTTSKIIQNKHSYDLAPALIIASKHSVDDTKHRGNSDPISQSITSQHEPIMFNYRKLNHSNTKIRSYSCLTTMKTKLTFKEHCHKTLRTMYWQINIDINVIHEKKEPKMSLLNRYFRLLSRCTISRLRLSRRILTLFCPRFLWNASLLNR